MLCKEGQHSMITFESFPELGMKVAALCADFVNGDARKRHFSP